MTLLFYNDMMCNTGNQLVTEDSICEQISDAGTHVFRELRFKKTIIAKVHLIASTTMQFLRVARCQPDAN